MKTIILILSITLFLYSPHENKEIISGTKAHEKFMQAHDNYGYNFTEHYFKGYVINSILGDPALKDKPFYHEMPYKGEGFGYWDKLIEKYPNFDFLMPKGLLNCKLTMQWNEDFLSVTGKYPESWLNSDARVNYYYSMDDCLQKWQHIKQLEAVQSNMRLAGDRWYNELGYEVGMKSYSRPNELLINIVINAGTNPYIPDLMPPSYASPTGQYWTELDSD